MYLMHSVLAIVLKTIPYEERHLIVQALTESHGRVTALARNAVQSRRFGGALELFTAAEWELSIKPDAEVWSLQSAQVKRSFDGIRKSFEKLSLASALNEIILRLAPASEASSLLFKLHSNALAILDENSFLNQKDYWHLLNGYLAKVLQWSGHQPMVQTCLCGKTSLLSLNTHFDGSRFSCSYERAGWFCHDCSEAHGHKHDVSALGLLDLLSAMHFPLKQALTHLQGDLEDHADLFMFLEGVLAYHVPGFDQSAIKSLKFLGLKSNLQPEAKSRPQNLHHLV